MSFPKTLKLEGEPLAIARRIHSVVKTAKAERERLDEEYQNALKEAGERHQLELNALFVQLIEKCGLPEQEHRCWGIDPRYLDDHDIAFLTREEENDSPDIGDILQSMIAQKH